MVDTVTSTVLYMDRKRNFEILTPFLTRPQLDALYRAGVQIVIEMDLPTFHLLDLADYRQSKIYFALMISGFRLP